MMDFFQLAAKIYMLFIDIFYWNILEWKSQEDP